MTRAPANTPAGILTTARAWPARCARWLPALALLLLAIAPSGCARESTDHDDQSPRLAVLSPALAIDCVDAGLERFIVARHAADFILDPDLPACADFDLLNYESLIGARPTHVLIQRSARGVPARLARLARERNWRLLELPVLSLEDMIETGDRVHALALDLGATPTHASPPSARIRSALRPVEGAAELGPILLLTQVAPASALGPGSFHHDILLALGATPAIGADHPLASPYVRLSVEDLAALRPAGIVLIRPRTMGMGSWTPRDEDDPGALLGRAAALDLPALDARRIVVIDHPTALTPSVAMIDFAGALRDTLRGWIESGAERP